MLEDENSPLEPLREQNEAVPERIGSYHILERLGDGGMGTVYLAEQKEPVRRRVALKVIRLGMASEEVLRRFEVERQALAVMNHPGIAKVFDAGTTESGQPYFVMEHVEGIPLTKYCDNHRLSITERIRLFQQVCAAVQHAHQKGVIHRDLKPGNVLVQRHGDRGMPKIIDFGLARATDQQLVAHTVFTEQGQMLGTPEYMSPEQATMDGEGIDTRTDIYSLGVMLYELLCGELPFSTAELRAGGLFEVQRKIREDEPQKPSTKIASAGPEASDSALRRRSNLTALMKNVRGDLDWIVMKAMAKEAERRYDSANGLAEDLGRHLEHEPVLAGPPSAGYRVRKFVRRYRTQAVAAALVFIALIVGIAGTTWQWSVASDRAEEIAEQKSEVEAQRERAEGETERARAAEEKTNQRASELEQVVAFQEEQISDVDPMKMGIDMRSGLIAEVRAVIGRSTSSKDIIEERLAALEKQLADVNFTNIALDTIEADLIMPTLAAIEEKFADQPLVMARLLEAEALVLLDFGLIKSAIEPQRRALDIRRKELGVENPDTLTSMWNMSWMLNTQGKYEEAGPFILEAYNTRLRVLDPDDRDRLKSLQMVGHLLHSQGKVAKGLELLKQAYESMRRKFGDNDVATLNLMLEIANVHSSQGKFKEAEGGLREALVRSRLLRAKDLRGRDKQITLLLLNNLGLLLKNQGRLTEAEPYYSEALKKKRSLRGDYNQSTHTTIAGMAFLRRDQGRLVEAESLFREKLAAVHRAFGEESPQFTQRLNELRTVLARRGDYLAIDQVDFWNDADGAEDHWQRMSAIAEGERTPTTSTDWVHAAYHLYGQGRFIEADLTFDEAFDDGGSSLREEHRYYAARAAVRAGAGEGEDAADLSNTDRLDLSRKGRAMLQEELAHWQKMNAEGDMQTAVNFRQSKQHIALREATWATLDPDLACVRDEEALSKLDDDEAEAWRAFWAEVRELPPPGR